ncbi:MAG: amidase [Bacillota bacterium]
MDELIYAPATALAKAIRTKAVSSTEVIDAYLRRIEAVNPRLNAIVQLTADTARAEARAADAALARGESTGPLHGVPLTIKDNIETAGVTCTAGTKGRATLVPTQDAPVVARLRAAGAIVLGKTNMPELGLAWETDNLLYGRTNNPYDVRYSPGGSSGGEAAIIAAGGSPLGLGTDLAGSIRHPAHCCGVAGIKPTSGRVPRTGHFPGPGGVTQPLVQTGPLARFVEDLTLTLPLIVGVDWRDPSVVPMPLGNPKTVELTQLRAAFYTDNGIAPPTPEIAAVVRAAAQVLADAGVSVEEARPPGIEQTYELYLGLLGADGGAGLHKRLQLIGTTEIHPLIQQAVELLGPYARSTTEFLELMMTVDLVRSSLLAFMETHEILLCPVNAYPALPHGRAWEHLPAFSYTVTYNFTGWPAAVVRAGTSREGLPIGVQIVAQPWREEVALAVAQHLEAAMGGWQRPPL